MNEMVDKLRKALPLSALGTSTDYDRKSFDVKVANSIRLEDILTPTWWMNCTTRLGVGDVVDVRREDGSLDVCLRVMKVGPGFVQMRPRFEPYVDNRNLPLLDPMTGERNTASNTQDMVDDQPVDLPPELQDSYKVGYAPNGSEKGYYVLHRASSAMVRKGLSNKTMAIEIAKSHAKEAAGETV